jgi:hypothetical protein
MFRLYVDYSSLIFGLYVDYSSIIFGLYVDYRLIIGHLQRYYSFIIGQLQFIQLLHNRIRNSLQLLLLSLQLLLRSLLRIIQPRNGLVNRSLEFGLVSGVKLGGKLSSERVTEVVSVGLEAILGGDTGCSCFVFGYKGEKKSQKLGGKEKRTKNTPLYFSASLTILAISSLDNQPLSLLMVMRLDLPVVLSEADTLNQM